MTLSLILSDFREENSLDVFSQSKNMSDADVVRAFHEAMLGICWRTSAEVPLLVYTAVTFEVEIREYGGLETAKKCLHSKELGAGFLALCAVNRLHLTLEALIHDNPKWHALFSEEELAICAARLGRYGYHKIVGDEQEPGRSPLAS